eukprot:TRINITY_DN5350_c0_g1_i2.p1 TRINITY_DN5350_c0_g1~~TRINITY_DN5350_c0_g1_i2.p1  ORF type:complete len:195 (-),score=37.52 TRINITY_DN5350_c0_g1_i2:55-639(-)
MHGGPFVVCECGCSVLRGLRESVCCACSWLGGASSCYAGCKNPTAAPTADLDRVDDRARMQVAAQLAADVHEIHELLLPVGVEGLRGSVGVAGRGHNLFELLKARRERERQKMLLGSIVGTTSAPATVATTREPLKEDETDLAGVVLRSAAIVVLLMILIYCCCRRGPEEEEENEKIDDVAEVWVFMQPDKAKT